MLYGEEVIGINYFNYMEKINEEMTELRKNIDDTEDSYNDVLDEIYWFIANYRNSKTDEDVSVVIDEFIESLMEKDIINLKTLNEYYESLKNYLEKRGEKS